ncbi:bacterio-opsin activator domain-containing protein [Haloarcula marina]|uniref:bacterio-opsin activator domain-containing protein n=1 Tax=Haloarcula marina TaxID=2961574 RepID=UPI0020B6C9B5|nr:bacterio-opsin activator domain-containing protein [Halomicroarcula marina]
MEKPVSDSAGQGATGSARESPRALLDALVARLPAPALVVGSELSVLAANEEFAGLVDQTRAQVIGTGLHTLFDGVSRERIDANCDREDASLTAPSATTDDDRWVDFTFERNRSDGETVYLGVGHDVTTRYRHEQRLEQYERIIETIDDGVFTLDESFTIETVNSALASMSGYAEEELVGADASLLADEDALDEAAQIVSEIRRGERDVGTLLTELQRADGERHPVETRFSTYRDADGSHRQVGVVRDVSERLNFAEMLGELHDTTRQLLHAETKEAVTEIIAETASDVLGVPASTIYLFDRHENQLRRTATAGTDTSGVTASGHEPPTVVGPGDGLIWDVFVDDTEVTLETGDSYRPLDEFGVFYAQTSIDDDARTRELLDILTSSAEAALARVDRETVLREREAERRRRNEELRQLEQVNEILRRVDRALVEAGTCEEIEQAVCSELAESGWFSFAWVGTCDGDTVHPQQWAGRSSGYLDAISMSAVGDGGPPAIQTAQSGEPTVVRSITDDLRQEHWRTEAISRNFQSAISVPLSYDDYLYGVLTVYADQTDAFGDTLESVFLELGESIGNAMQEIASRQRHPTDSVVELELSLSTPESTLSRLAESLDGPVECEGVVPSGADTTRLFLRIADDGLALESLGGEIGRIETITQVSDDGRYEVTVNGSTVPATLLDYGAQLLEVEAEANHVDAVVHLAADTDVRAFVEQLERAYPSVQMHARRERSTQHLTENNLRAVLEERLTERQLEVLQTAYFSGFFDWPRETTGEEVASLLGITQPTVNRHLRVGERKLLELVLDED